MKKFNFTFICIFIATLLFSTQARVVEPVTKVKVKNETEFLKALGNNRVITIAKGTRLNLSTILEDYEKTLEANLVWSEDDYDYSQLSQFSTAASEGDFDGRQLTLMKIHHLTIIGEKNVTIVVNPRYANVFNMVQCNNIKIQNVTLGHTEEGYCTGGVIFAKDCEDITIEDCDLFGCGTYGIEAINSRGITMTRSIIRDCSYGIMELRGCKFVNFEKCDFVRNREYGLVCIDANCQWIRFDDCRWAQNNGPLFELGTSIKLDGCEIHHPHWQVNKHKLEGLVDEQSENKWLEDLQPLQPRKIGPKK